MLDSNDLPSSTRSIRRRTSLLEKSRNWARRFITLHRPRRNTISNDIIPDLTLANPSSDKFLSNNEKNFDEDGYLSPMEIKAHFNNPPSKVMTPHSPALIYRYHDPNLSSMKRYPTTSFVSEFQKSLSIVDYIDVDLGDEMPIDDDPLDSVKYLFSQSTNRRLPRRTTNVSSISTDSGYSDQLSSSKLVPVQILSCSLIPVNVRCLTCTCHQRKYSSNRSICNHKSHSTMTIYPTKQSSTTDDLIAISRWYKPYLEREAVHNVLQQADYGAFILRHSTTHTDCYALSIKVPKFTHDSNIVHYLIEKSMSNNQLSYRIKGTTKQFPTLMALLTHHSVMPEILPITLNLNESFTI